MAINFILSPCKNPNSRLGLTSFEIVIGHSGISIFFFTGLSEH